MEFIKLLSGLKFKSYHLAMQFLLSITVPGILILFYFYKDLFNTYDIYRLIMLIISISSSLFICSYAICSSIIFTLGLKNKVEYDIDDENDYLEGMFQMSSQFSLVILFLLLLIYFLCGSKNVHSFVIWFIIIEAIYGLLIYFSLKNIIKEAKEKNEKEKKDALEAEKNREIRIQQIKEELYKHQRLLKKTELELEETNKFQLLRTSETKKSQILAINDKLIRIKSKITELENELEQLK